MIESRKKTTCCAEVKTHHDIAAMSKVIRKYTNERYPRWLDYAQYHSSIAKIPDEANDILNEVLLSLFSKDFEYLVNLYLSKKNQYTALDFYVLRMIKLNTQSKTSPYQHKYIGRHKKYIDTDADINRFEILLETEEPEDRAGIILAQYRLVLYVFNALDLTEFERRVFVHRFVRDESFKDWPDKGLKNKLYNTFTNVRTAIHVVLKKQQLTTKEPNANLCTKRVNDLVRRFFMTRRVKIKRSYN